MYESFFGFRQRPFLAVPTLDRYFPASSIEQAIAAVTRCVQRGEGPAAVMGGAGLGKTMCCLKLAQHFQAQFDVVALASSQICTRRALLQCLLYELQLPYHNQTEGELRLALNQRLLPSPDRASDGLVLIVDEAQTLSTKLLDELRLITNVVDQGVPRVRLVLCGTMKLEDLLAHPHSESLNQRIASRSYLVPLTGQETGRYIRHKLEVSGGLVSEVMTEDAIDALYRGSDGVPRLIDQLADHALWSASQLKIKPLNASIVGHAWSALQQLPNPWSEPILSSFATPTTAAMGLQHRADSMASLLGPNTNTTFEADGTRALLAAASPSFPMRVSHGVEFGSLEDTEPTEPYRSAVDSHPLGPMPNPLGSTHSQGGSAELPSDAIAPGDMELSHGPGSQRPEVKAPWWHLETVDAQEDEERSAASHEPRPAKNLFQSFFVREAGLVLSANPKKEAFGGSAVSVHNALSSAEGGSTALNEAADATSIDGTPRMEIVLGGSNRGNEDSCTTLETIPSPVAEAFSCTAIASHFVEGSDTREAMDLGEQNSVPNSGSESWESALEQRGAGLAFHHASPIPTASLIPNVNLHDAERAMEVELRELVSHIQDTIHLEVSDVWPSAGCREGFDGVASVANSSAMVSGDDRDMILIDEGTQPEEDSDGGPKPRSARIKPSVFAKWF